MGWHDPGYHRTSEQQVDHAPIATIIVLLGAAILVFALLVFLAATWGMGTYLKAGRLVEAIIPPLRL